LIQEALRGEVVILAKDNKPLVRSDVLPEAKRKRFLGGAKHLVIKMDDDFNESVEDFSEYME
jgi:hypothetical protein